MPAFQSPSGIPYSDVNLATMIAHSPKWSPDSSTSEVTTLQLEFRDLSKCTGDRTYEEVNSNSLGLQCKYLLIFNTRAPGHRKNQSKDSRFGEEKWTRTDLHQRQHRNISQFCNNITWCTRRFVLRIPVEAMDSNWKERERHVSNNN